MLCKRDVSVSHNLCGKGLWEEQLSGWSDQIAALPQFSFCAWMWPERWCCLCYGLIRPTLEELQLTPAVTTVLRVQSHGPWGRFGDSVGQVRPWEALARSLAGEGAAFGKWLWLAGGM